MIEYDRYDRPSHPTCKASSQGTCNPSDLQGVPEKTLISVQRPITQVWKQVLGQVGAVFKSSGYQLLFEPKKSRII